MSMKSRYPNAYAHLYKKRYAELRERKAKPEKAAKLAHKWTCDWLYQHEQENCSWMNDERWSRFIGWVDVQSFMQIIPRPQSKGGKQ